MSRFFVCIISIGFLVFSLILQSFNPGIALAKGKISEECQCFEATASEHGANVYYKPSTSADVETYLEPLSTLFFQGELVFNSETWYYFNTFMGFRYVSITDLNSVECSEKGE